MQLALVDPPKGVSMILVSKHCDQTRQRGHNLSTVNSMFARLGTDYEIRNQWFFTILKTMTTDSDLSQWKCNARLQQAVSLIICASESDNY